MNNAPVWLGMSQEELDAAYDQLKYAPNQMQVLERFARNSEQARGRLGQPLRWAYGESTVEALDVYTTQQPHAPVCVFIHGGAWRSGLARNYGFLAELFTNAGAHLVVPDFVSVLETDGDLLPMAEQVQAAIAWVYRHASRFGGNADQIYVCGHSSGAHLAAVALYAPWRQSHGLPGNLLKGAVCCGGLYDLRPVRLSARSSYVRLTDETELALSPMRHLGHIHTPLVVAHGSLETPEFIRQSREFAQALAAAAKPVELLTADACNHFEILETLANPYGLLGRAALRQMGLGPAH